MYKTLSLLILSIIFLSACSQQSKCDKLKERRSSLAFKAAAHWEGKTNLDRSVLAKSLAEISKIASLQKKLGCYPSKNIAKKEFCNRFTVSYDGYALKYSIMYKYDKSDLNDLYNHNDLIAVDSFINAHRHRFIRIGEKTRGVLISKNITKSYEGMVKIRFHGCHQTCTVHTKQIDMYNDKYHD